MASRRTESSSGPSAASIALILQEERAPLVRKSLQAWSNMSPSVTQAARYRDLKIPSMATTLIRKFPEDDILAAYASRLIDQSIVPIPQPGAQAVTLDSKVLGAVISQMPDFWNLVATRLAKPSATWAEKYNWCSVLTQMNLSNHFPLADFLKAEPPILGTWAASLRLTGEDMTKEFAQKDYPYDVVAFRFAMEPSEASKVAKLAKIYAESCKQMVSDILAKTVRLLASRISTPQMFLDAIKSSPNMIVDLVDVVINEPVPKNLPQSMCTSICAGTIAVLMNIPFRETEEIDLETRNFSISQNTYERLNFLLSHETDWLHRVLNFLQPGVVDFFDRGMKSISQYCTDAHMSSLGFGISGARIQPGAIQNLAEVGSGLFGLLTYLTAFEPAMEKYSSRILNVLHGTVGRIFRESVDRNPSPATQARLHYFTQQLTIKNVFDEKGNVVLVAALPNVTGACLVGLIRLIRQRRYTMSELETSLADGGIKPFFYTMAKKSKEHGNSKYEEGMRNRQMLETALAAYTVAIATALPDDPEKFIYYSNRAQVFLERKLYAEAVIDCRRALALQPNHAKTQARLAIALENVDSNNVD